MKEYKKDKESSYLMYLDVKNIWMGNGKTMENLRNYRGIITTDKRRNSLVSEPPNYYTTKRFSKNLLAIERKKLKIKMNKPVYLAILEICKALMYGSTK